VTVISELLPDFILLPPLDLAAAAAWTPLVPQNPARWMWWLAWNGIGTMQLTTSKSSPTTGTGAISANNSPFEFNFRDHAILATSQWWYGDNTAGSLLHVEQIEYRPLGQPATFEQMVALAARLRGSNA
jgi:hypothetical protein